MGRKTKQNSITTPELLEKLNKDNSRLMNDYLLYLKSIQRSVETIAAYKNDLEIFFVWCFKNAKDKFFVDLTKRDIIAFQNFMLYENENSPARVRRLKATLSSLSNYIESILDDEYPNFRNIIRKVENPINQPTREKTVFTDEELDTLLDYLIEKKRYQKACVVAIAMCSGSRKAEIPRFKVDYFNDENIIYGSLYKSPEKMKTKGRGKGKFIYRYVLVNKFKPYLDMWLKERERLKIDSEWLFVTKKNKTGEIQQLKPETMNSWAVSFTKILNKDFYFHSLRHYFTTSLARLSIPDNVIQEIIGWNTADMVKIYKDISTDEEIGKYFDENGVKEVKKVGLSDL